jgi:hypothetical protein
VCAPGKGKKRSMLRPRDDAEALRRDREAINRIANGPGMIMPAVPAPSAASGWSVGYLQSHGIAGATWAARLSISNRIGDREERG